MLCKLAFRNMRKSFSDFTVYFLTLMFGVAAFYSFGSIEDQNAMATLGVHAAESTRQLSTVMNVMSAIVAVVLAFLMTYANRFLIRRRNREFGTYLILGMPRRQVAAILVMETMLVGAMALGVGLALGIAGSQGLSVLSARLFELDMTEYRFVFSATSMAKTTALFTLLFAVVSVLNLTCFSRQTISELLIASKRKEPRLRSRIVSVALTLTGLCLTAIAFWRVLDEGLLGSLSSGALLPDALTGMLGTLLLFAGGSSLILRLPQSQAIKGLYLQGLNSFVFRQLESKMNSTYITMSVACVTLFFAIVTLSGGIALSGALNDRAKMPYDASFILNEKPSSASTITAGLAQAGVDSGKFFSAFHEFSFFKSETRLGDLVSHSDLDDLPIDTVLPVLRESDANALLKLQGKTPVDLGNDGFAVFDSNVSLRQSLQDGYPLAHIRFAGKTLHAVQNGLVDTMPALDPGGSVPTALVVPDQLIDQDLAYKAVLDVIYRPNLDAAEQALVDSLSSFDGTNEFALDYQIVTKQGNIAGSITSKAITTYIGLYIGLVLLVTSAAILALQQLSEAAENKERYTVLSRIGADCSMIGKAVTAQVAVYFGAPLVVALAYSLVGSKAILDVVQRLGGVGSSGRYVLTVMALVLVYGVYFVATSSAARRIALER